MIDNREHDEMMLILEEMEDQSLAASLLKGFNDYSRDLGQLILNLDKKLSHEDWKVKCDKLQEKLDEVILKIKENRR